MSATDVLHPIFAALKGAEEFLGPNRVWTPLNPAQERLLAFLETHLSDLTKIPEMKTKASYDAEAINTFLEQHGFTIQLEPFKDGEFGVASLMQILVEWLRPGRAFKMTSRHDGKEYDAVSLPDDAGATFHDARSEGIRCTFVRIPTKNGDSICLLPTNKVGRPRPQFLLDIVQEVRASATHNQGFEGVHFPMVDLDESKDLDWLLGMETAAQSGRPHSISQAKQQTRLKMNQHGAKMESAVAIGIMATSVRRTPPPFIVDGPFLFWAERPGVGLPYFCAYVTQEAWKNPGEIGTTPAVPFARLAEIANAPKTSGKKKRSRKRGKGKKSRKAAKKAT
jgi:hypothetical protein